MTTEYRAFIVLPGGHEDPLAEKAMLSVVLDGPGRGERRVLRMTSKGWLWEEVREGVSILPTLELPGEALAAIVDAVHRLDGYRPGAEGVLREWLAAERKRTDQMFDLAMHPQVWDLGHQPGVILPKP